MIKVKSKILCIIGVIIFIPASFYSTMKSDYSIPVFLVMSLGTIILICGLKIKF